MGDRVVTVDDFGPDGTTTLYALTLIDDGLSVMFEEVDDGE